jgi:hypothetical protein
MRKFGLSFAIAAALGAGALMTAPAQAAPVPAGLASTLNTASIAPSLVEKAQFIWGGRNYCFYLDGWHGPGWYWCGYSHRRGYGWGGPRGWHGWHHERPRHRPVYRHHERRHDRRHDHRR